jgi:hypothetical protein
LQQYTTKNTYSSKKNNVFFEKKVANKINIANFDTQYKE